MSKESLNDFYNSGKFNKDLRNRVNEFEPELSDSLWDRIEHDLDQQDNKGKRAFWLVYVLGALLLVSSAGLYYLWDQNKELAQKIDEPVVHAEAIEPDEPIQPSSNNNVPSSTEAIDPSATAPQAGGPSTNQAVRRPYQAGSSLNWGSEEIEESPAVTPVDPSHEGEEVSPESIPAQSELPGKEEKEVAPETSPELKTDKTDSDPKKKETPDVKDPIKKDPVVGNTKPAISWTVSTFAGMDRVKSNPFGEYAFPFRSLDGKSMGMDHPVSFGTYGLNLQMTHRSGWGARIGIVSFATGETVKYNRLKIQRPGPGGASPDSMVIGDEYTHVNRRNWVEIPVEVLYQMNLGNKWVVGTSLGLSWAIANGYSGMQMTPAYKVGWSELGVDTEGNKKDLYRNHASMLLGLNVGYRITNKWTVSAAFNHRRALYSIAAIRDHNLPDRQPTSFGGRVGLAYTIK